MELTVEELCTAELGAQDYRRRCFQAEAQLRLERLKRRGEQHPRWPADGSARQTLLGARGKLEASDIVEGTKEAVKGLVESKMLLGELQDDLERVTDEVRRCQKEAEREREDASSLLERRPGEELGFSERERQMTLDKERAKDLSRLLEDSLAAENDLAEQVALGQDASEVVRRRLQSFLPGQQKTQEEARKALQAAEKFRLLAVRRREAVRAAEEEVEEVEKSCSAEHDALKQRLEQTREEVSEMVAKTAELSDQTKKAHVTYTKQIKAVKEGGTALRDALSEVGQEKEDLQLQLEQLREVVESASQEHRARESRVEAQEAANKALEEEMSRAQESLQLAEVAHKEATGNRSDVVKAGLLKAKETLSTAQEDAQKAALEAQEALQHLEALRAEQRRLRGETGEDASRKRAQMREALQKEVAQLKGELEAHEVGCQKVHQKMELQRQLREAQTFARCAAKESAAALRGGYGDLARGKPGDGAAAQRNARRLTRHLEDFLRFLQEAVALAEEKHLERRTLNLPLALKEAYVGKLGQGENGGTVQELSSVKEKLKVVRSELQEAEEGRQKDVGRLKEDCADLKERIRAGEAECTAEQEKALEARERLSEGITEAGCQQNEAQMKQVAVQSISHEQDMALLRQEREHLKAKLAMVGESERVLGSPVASRLKQRELELEDVRKRLQHSRERYLLLVADAGGHDAMKDLGVKPQAVRNGSPRPLTRPAESATSMVRSKSLVAFRDLDVAPSDLRLRATPATPGTEAAPEVGGPGVDSPMPAEPVTVTDHHILKVESTPSPSSQTALSTPWGDMEAAEPTPKSGFELASPSRLPETLAEARQRDLEADEALPLRLEPAPSRSEVRTVTLSPARSESQPEEPRRPVPALSMSWAEMEAAALDPTPKCSDALSPSYPSEPLEDAASPASARPQPQAAYVAPAWEPVAAPRRQLWPLYRVSPVPVAVRPRSMSPTPCVVMRWGVIGQEAMSPRRMVAQAQPAPQVQAAVAVAPQVQPQVGREEVEHVWVDDPVLREPSLAAGSPVITDWQTSPSSKDCSLSQESTPQLKQRLIRPCSRPSSPPQAPRAPQVAAKCGVEATPEPSWASHVLEMGVKLPEPQLPALEDLFAKNIQEQTAWRKLKKQRERMQKAVKEPVAPVEPREAFFTSIVKL